MCDLCQEAIESGLWKELDDEETVKYLNKHKQAYPNIKKLLKEAIEAPAWRGHELGKFEREKYAYAECIYCGKWVQCV